MTQIPIPPEAEAPCPEPECRGTLKPTYEVKVDGPFATVTVVCLNLHRRDFTWPWGDRW